MCSIKEALVYGTMMLMVLLILLTHETKRHFSRRDISTNYFCTIMVHLCNFVMSFLLLTNF